MPNMVVSDGFLPAVLTRPKVRLHTVLPLGHQRHHDADVAWASFNAARMALRPAFLVLVPLVRTSSSSAVGVVWTVSAAWAVGVPVTKVVAATAPDHDLGKAHGEHSSSSAHPDAPSSPAGYLASGCTARRPAPRRSLRRLSLFGGLPETLRAIASRWVSQVPQPPPQMSRWGSALRWRPCVTEVHGIAGLQMPQSAQLDLVPLGGVPDAGCAPTLEPVPRFRAPAGTRRGANS